MNTAGTNVVYRVCSSAGGSPCNAVETFDECAGFDIRDGSPAFIREGGGAATDGGGVEEELVDETDTGSVGSAAAPAEARCEAFDSSDPDVALCAPFIEDGAMVYVPGGETPGDLLSKNLGLSLILDSFPFVSSNCQSSFGSFWCRSRLRGCEIVEAPSGNVSLPQLICREDCDSHSSDCANDYEAILVESYLGQIAVQQGDTVTAPMCNLNLEGSQTDQDSQMVWFMYRHGGEVTYDGNFPLLVSTLIPELLPSQQLYPAEHTVYVDGGVEFAIPCMVLEASKTSIEVLCPTPLVANPDAGRLGENQCLLPCPSFMYTGGEYHGVMLALVVPGVLGVLGNAYMVVTHFFGSKTVTGEIATEVKLASFVGLLWGLMSPSLSAIFFTDVACADGCTTMSCAGQGFVCMLNRNSVFLLQCIQWLFASLLAVLHANTSLTKSREATQKMKVWLVGLSFTLPATCLILANILHTTDPKAPNAAVNEIRDAFSCHPHFYSSAIEFFLIYAPFLVGGGITQYCVFHVIKRLYQAQLSAMGHRISVVKQQVRRASQAPTTMGRPAENVSAAAPPRRNIGSGKKKNLQARKRLVCAGMLVSILFIATTMGTMLILPTMSVFGDQEKIWFGPRFHAKPPLSMFFYPSFSLA
jgi:hypothetical protein